ncbi:hypothetical protein NIES4071_106580 (plasmid) [Calothrix sp. NIES-4071]|nr:hypothetical protein NIES4071_106580 [Calothrix sp. NIES-4071]BAZ65076.1 hypothetical protein NIES4105_108090 [Calothrix sp. NIES-4105]
MDNSYLSAPYRNYLSATAKLILKLGLLSQEESHLDYGCGRGGDVERLQAMGYNSTGWDPYYFPGVTKAADVVTMNYVLNVIKDIEERRQALLNAWSLTKKRLIISANVRGAGLYNGEVTPLGTFTKFFNHVELKAYIESTLGYEAIKLTKDKFLINRNGKQFTTLHHDEVINRAIAIASSGWIPPMDCIIKGYCNDFKPRPGADFIDDGQFPGRIRHYRLLSKTRSLPNKNGQLVKVLHISGGKNSEQMQFCIEALRRRNQIAQLKFHCVEQTFLNEFLGARKFDFLDYKNIKIYN